MFVLAVAASDLARDMILPSLKSTGTLDNVNLFNLGLPSVFVVVPVEVDGTGNDSPWGSLQLFKYVNIEYVFVITMMYLFWGLGYKDLNMYE